LAHVNLRHFFALCDIADLGRLSAAADRAFLSQSALTQGLQKLEEHADTPLFERAGFGVSPTPAGELLVKRARRARALLDRAETQVRQATAGAPGSGPLHRHVTASQLRALVAIVDTGGYSTAARRLGLAQPTVHRAAKDLEQLLGMSLFPRAPRGIEPTATARTLARFSQLMFVELRQGLEEVHELQGATRSRVAVGCLPLARSEFLPLAVTELLERFPDARVSILDGPYVEQLHALRYGQIDWLIGALRQPAPAADVVEHHLFEQPLAVVVRPGHPLLAAGSPGIEQLAGLEWIAPPPLAPTRQYLDDFFKRNGMPAPTSVVECSSLVATRGLLRRSDRAALLSPLQVRDDMDSGQLALLADSMPDSSRAIGVTVRDNWEPTRVQAEFDRILRRLAENLRLPPAMG